MSAYRKVFIVCPGNAMTAGPEALHQLGADLIRLGQPAAMVYYPFDRRFETAQPYVQYGVPVETYRDEPGTLVIFPEIFTSLALRLKQGEAAIWWMSVNNYTCVRYGNPLRDKLRYWKYVIKGTRPWRGLPALKGLRHFAQSHYAGRFLAENGLVSEPLSDPIPSYTEPAYLAGLPARLASARRENVILYNPTKGAKITARLMAACPDFSFRPLKGLDRDQLAEAFLSARIYMDFGHHPGKDRLPREAALHGCCVITGRYGSAANEVDVPIPAGWKLDDRAEGFPAAFRALVQGIFADFDGAAALLADYRAVIAREQIEFDGHIIRAFGLAGAAA